jgi:drug/metabolite transporter (DMT)-like permease
MQIPLTGYSNEAYLWLLAIALIPQLIGHSSFNYALKQLSATYIGIASQLEPAFSAILAYLAFREVPSEWQTRGSVVILIGVVVATLGQARRRKSAPADLLPEIN